MIKLKRVYDPPAADDGFRVLVDRLWPRGLTKEKAALDLWLKEVAPSPGLRTWFNHEPGRFAEFSARYQSELATNPAVVELRKIIKDKGQVSLLYGAKDPQINHAVVLKKFLEG